MDIQVAFGRDEGQFIHILVVEREFQLRLRIVSDEEVNFLLLIDHAVARLDAILQMVRQILKDHVLMEGVPLHE